MLICNNGNVGKKSSHKAFRTSKFLESARKRRRRWSIKQISLGALSVLLFCSAQCSALCSAQFLIPSDNFDVIPSTWCLREHQVLPHFKNIVWDQIDQCRTLEKHSMEILSYDLKTTAPSNPAPEMLSRFEECGVVCLESSIQTLDIWLKLKSSAYREVGSIQIRCSLQTPDNISISLPLSHIVSNHSLSYGFRII